MIGHSRSIFWHRPNRDDILFSTWFKSLTHGFSQNQSGDFYYFEVWLFCVLPQRFATFLFGLSVWFFKMDFNLLLDLLNTGLNLSKICRSISCFHWQDCNVYSIEESSSLADVWKHWFSIERLNLLPEGLPSNSKTVLDVKIFFYGSSFTKGRCIIPKDNRMQFSLMYFKFCTKTILIFLASSTILKSCWSTSYVRKKGRNYPF